MTYKATLLPRTTYFMIQTTHLNKIILLSFIIRILHLFLLYFYGPGFLTEDSSLYLTGANWLAQTGEFLTGPVESPHPETERMYGYISIIAILDIVFGDPVWGIILLQLFADCATVAFIALSAERLGSKVGLCAGILAALWPNMILHSGLILTDTLALTAAAALIWSFIRFYETPTFRRAIVIGLALGIGLAIRQGLLFLVPVIAVLMGSAAIRKHLGWRKAVTFCLAPLVITTLFLLPQVERHREATGGRIVLTSQTGTHLLNWITAEVYAATKGGSRPEWAKKFNQEIKNLYRTDNPQSYVSNFEQSDAMSALALEKLQAIRFSEVTFVFFSRSFVNLFTPSLAFHPMIRALKSNSFDQTSSSEGYIYRVVQFLKSQPPVYVLAVLLAGFFSALIALFSAIGFIMGFRTHLLFSLLGVGYVGYIMMLNGPIAGAKYALPADLIIIIWAAYGIFIIGNVVFKSPRCFQSHPV